MVSVFLVILFLLLFCTECCRPVAVVSAHYGWHVLPCFYAINLEMVRSDQLRAMGKCLVVAYVLYEFLVL
jgi:hypothetical protein